MTTVTCRRCSSEIAKGQGIRVTWGRLRVTLCPACGVNAVQAAKPNKYRAVKTEVDGFVFDSAREAQVYAELKIREQAGEIRALTRQPKFPIRAGTQTVATYVADFEYLERGQRVIVDVKGVKTAVYRLKKKLVEALHQVTITEVR